ncbi:FGGY-family carbohydrate kinase [Rahnella woolbedingensis]|uniref:Carbohydrate kinase n=1 Tax=Rahnella woolbedingensis TaxID=1510574 RepID=A0A419N5W7_9GAMM|nr:FGGY-family carbohydrate kinase [Rahnella woolbedingensis]RJT42186.1 carbohydrate kinase [Rahnella woolbedingensis]
MKISSEEYWLGIDCGGTYLKAGLYDSKGQEAGVCRQPLPVLSDHPGWAERDMPALWASCISCITTLLYQQNVSGQQVKGIGISAQGKGLFLLDKAGQPLGRGILSSDRRAADVISAWERDGLHQQIYPLTRQALWAGHPVSLLRWIKLHQPQRYQQIGSVMMAHDYLRYRLTGEQGCEETNISESNLYHMARGGYAPELTEMLGITEISAALPPVVGSAEICGTVTQSIAALTGLAPGTPVTGGLFDVVSTALCAGLQDEFTLNAVMGTWAVTSGICATVSKNETHPYVYGRYAGGEGYLIHEASPTSSANLEWLNRQSGELSFEEINRAVGALPKAGSDVLFLPFLYGSNQGAEMTAGFYGLQSLHHRGHLLQAVFEGVVFSHMTHLNRMLQRFPQAKTLRVTGGPTRSEIWMQMLADVSGMPVELPQIEETGCLGAALAAMVGTGVYSTFAQAQQHLNYEVRRLEPDTASHSAYQKKLQRYQFLIDALGVYHARCAAADKSGSSDHD